MTVVSTKIASVADFVAALALHEAPVGHHVFYRGHADRTWKVLPSLLRNDEFLKYENTSIREMIAQYPEAFDHDRSTFDVLTRLQHYGVRTRLLDISKAPLVSLYFATEPLGLEPDPDGAVIILEVPTSRRKFFDSDTVSCMANLAYLDHDELEALSKSKASTISDFNKLKPSRRLLQFIKAEKPYFEPEIVKSDLHYPLAVIAKSRNARMIAQQGSFLLFGLEQKRPSGRLIKQLHLVIDGSAKQKIRLELEDLGITHPVLFPEIDKASSHLMKKYSSGRT